MNIKFIERYATGDSKPGYYLKIMGCNLIFSFLFSGCMYVSSDNKSSSTDEINQINIAVQPDCYAVDIYFREYLKKGNEVVFYSDGIGKLISLGREYEIPLNSMVVFPLLIRRLKNDSLLDEMLGDAVKSRNVPGLESLSGFAPEYTSLLNTYRRLESSNYLKWFDFNRTIALIDSMQEKKVFSLDLLSEGNLSGKILINRHSLLQDSIILENTPWFNIQEHRFVKGWLKIKFSLFDQLSYPKEISGGYVMNDIKVYSQIFFLREPVKRSTFNTKKSSDLLVYCQNPIVYYDSLTWEGLILNLDSDLNEFIVRDLGYKDNIYQLFGENIGSAFYSQVYHGEVIPEIRDLKILYENLKENLY